MADPRQPEAEWHTEGGRSLRARRVVAAGAAFVVAGLGLTALVAHELEGRSARLANERFERLASRMVETVRDRASLFEYGLRGGRGALVANPQLDLRGWRDYIATRDIEGEFFGALGFGYIARVPSEDVAAFEGRVRAEGASEFQVHTRGLADSPPREERFVIQYIEPLGPNQRALGLDIGAESRRREAAERAMRTGQAALTAPIDLVQVDEVHRGFLYLLPVYEHAAATETAREAALRGWVYAPIVMSRAMEGVQALGDGLVDVEVFDGDASSRDALLFDGDGHLLEAPELGVDSLYGDRRFVESRALAVGGRTWTVRLTSLPSFETQYAGSGAGVAWLIGVTSTLSMLAVGLSSGGARRRAERLARARTVELRARNAELEAARRVADAATEAKGRFLANMSHELRTPMTAILGFAQYLDDPAVPAAERSEYAAAIVRNGDHMLHLVNEILDLSKIEAGKMTVEALETSLVEIVRDIHAALRPRAQEKALRFDVQWLTPMPDPIVSDPTRLRQVLINLVGNALKFTERGGVRIELECLPGDSPRLAVRVVDTGKGMAPEALEHLFEPFVQADDSVTRQFGGTGLGLAISRQLAQLLGGDLSARCELGRGCAFVLDLPITTSPATRFVDAVRVTPGDLGRATAPVPSLSGRILLVDDGPDNRRLFSVVLERAGLEVSTAGDGCQAVDAVLAAERAGAPFDLVLMDVQMPELDGLSATRALRRDGVTAPIVALTANATREDRERCLAAGYTDFLSKPVDRPRLYEVCARLLGERAAAGPALPARLSV